ncbi:hypothetical protein R2601_04143 [Salipiger bermudensis HTCC2601]|uniref:Uncharacterized protein n=1 Tax=Salipiger bermudensis (strain DSM 26914 / JCM 13377 / KCTC 12554 / HTCC2601) TaxID=314265 RepID=Q0FW17_SALBH|nr:hypothetical protein R2601_04143 [Salipiger bermudensis HTCC2601]
MTCTRISSRWPWPSFWPPSSRKKSRAW